jgi:hypothetical protein
MNTAQLASSLLLDSSAVEFLTNTLASWAEPAQRLWDSSEWFTKDRWNRFTLGFRVFLPLLTAFALMYEARARRVGEVLNERLKQYVAISLTVLGFGLYFDLGNPNTRYADYYHRHEFYHYYIGSKYSTEIGYKRLYECSAIAEIELGRAENIRKREIRDLRVNLIKPMTESYVFSDPAQCKMHFTPERWEAFKRDVDWFYKSAAGSYWENMSKDHGYNPPPVWTMTGKALASIAPASDTFFKLLSGIDVLFHLGIVLLIRWAFGWRVMAVATVWWGCNGPANFYWTGGAFLRQDWIFLLVAALCFAKKRWFALAGAALTWSALLRVFPLILFAGWGLLIAFYVFDRFKNHPSEVRFLQLRTWMHRDHRRLLAGCIIAGGLLVPASVVATTPNSYLDFFKHTIATHNHTPLTNHMGLETMLVHTWEGRMRFTRDDNLDDPFAGWKDGRTQRFAERKWVFRGIIVGLGLWTAWALRRTKLLWVALPLGLPLTMGLTNLTCYYYSMFIIAAALVAVRPQFGPAFLATSSVSQIVWDKYYFVDDKFTAMSYLFALICVLMLFTYSRPFSMERLLAWWHGRPEPRGAPRAPAQGGPNSTTEAPANT